MHEETVPDLRNYLLARTDDLSVLRQNRLLAEPRLIAFARDRGLPISGIIEGDPSEFCARGWLPSDGTDWDGGRMFHPFRIYPIHKILKACELSLAPSSLLQRNRVGELAALASRILPPLERVSAIADSANRIVGLAILLEPIYWQQVTSMQANFTGLADSEYALLSDEYRAKVREMVQSLEPELWRRAHERLRIDAALMDENSRLYVMLRVGGWRVREELKGQVGGALWIRHIAELLRRAFEDVHQVSWLEEDQAFGSWYPEGRRLVFGDTRPLDDALRTQPYIARAFGLFTGSVVRWYVEGHTEYYAVVEALPDASKAGIEIVNLRGTIESERDNTALKLREWLMQDRALRRFSILSFDTDVPASVRAIGRQIAAGNIVGRISAHQPDFEFGNFTLEELVEIAARIDEAQGVSGDTVREGDWAGVRSGRGFEKTYTGVSARRPGSLKGEVWGRALARYAMEQPERPDTGKLRAFVGDIHAALRSRRAHYDFQKENFAFKPGTFEIVDLRSSAPSGESK